MAAIIYLAFNIYSLGLLVYVVCSWINHPTALNLKRRLQQWYEPLLKPIQAVLPPVSIGNNRIDLSPALLFVAIWLLRSMVVPLFILP